MGIAYAQSYLFQVRDAHTQEPIPFATVQSLNRKAGALTNLQGEVTWNYQPHETLQVRCLGYEPALWTAGDATTIFLRPQPIDLPSVTITPEDNPALALIRRLQAQKNRYRLDRAPHRLLTYTKILLRPNFVDSLFQKMHMLLWETWTEKFYLSPTTSREITLRNRLSGFSQFPIPVTPTTFQSLSAYQDWLEILQRKVYSPIGKDALSYYHYEIVDTTYDQKDTIYTLRFFPQKNRKAWGMQGTLLMHTDGDALVALQGYAPLPTDEMQQFALDTLHIRQLYKKWNDTLWGPHQLYTSLAFHLQNQPNLPFILRAQSEVYEYEHHLSTRLNRRNEFQLESEERRALPEIPLDSLELRTYVVMDSLFQKRKTFLLWLVESLPRLIQGWLPMPPVEWDLRRLLYSSAAEGYAGGVGLGYGRKNFRAETWAAYAWGKKADWVAPRLRMGINLFLGKPFHQVHLSAAQDVREATAPRLLHQLPPQAPLGHALPYEKFERYLQLDTTELFGLNHATFTLRNLLLGVLWTEIRLSYEAYTYQKRSQGYALPMHVILHYSPRQSFLTGYGTYLRQTQGPQLLAALRYNLPSEPPWSRLWHVEGMLYTPFSFLPYLEGTLSLQGGALDPATPPFLQHAVRYMKPSNPFSLADALLALPSTRPLRATQWGYVSMRWHIVNTRFPSPGWRPTVGGVLQSYFQKGSIPYLEGGIELQRLIPLKLQEKSNLLRSLAGLGVGAYYPLSEGRREKVVFRIRSSL
ncbi:MAG: DUF5686 family protein [Bacteroidia bacterium]